MNKTCKPVGKGGHRNIFCPYYNECLNYAIQEYWEDWNCTSCENVANEEAKPEMRMTVSGSVPYYELLLDS